MFEKLAKKPPPFLFSTGAWRAFEQPNRPCQLYLIRCRDCGQQARHPLGETEGGQNPGFMAVVRHPVRMAMCMPVTIIDIIMRMTVGMRLRRVVRKESDVVVLDWLLMRAQANGRQNKKRSHQHAG